jgi:hypothetical protein
MSCAKYHRSIAKQINLPRRWQWRWHRPLNYFHILWCRENPFPQVSARKKPIPWHGILSQVCFVARMFHELLWRDREDGRATWQPQGVDSEAYLNGTSQDEFVLPVPSVVAGSLSKEHPRTPGRTIISLVAAGDS